MFCLRNNKIIFLFYALLTEVLNMYIINHIVWITVPPIDSVIHSITGYNHNVMNRNFGYSSNQCNLALRFIFVMLNSAEHRIYPAHNVKIPTMVGILTFSSNINTTSERF